jgi:hypothetical protein
MFFIVLYFFLLLAVLPSLVRNLKFRAKALSRLEKLNSSYASKLNYGFRFRSFSFLLKKLNGFTSKSLFRFSLFTSFVNFYVSSAKQLAGLNGLLQDSFSDLVVKKDFFVK